MDFQWPPCRYAAEGNYFGEMNRKANKSLFYIALCVYVRRTEHGKSQRRAGEKQFIETVSNEWSGRCYVAK